MPDSRFFRRAGPFSLQEIAAWADAGIASPGPAALQIADIATLSAAGPADIVYVTDAAYLDALSASRCGACVVEEDWVFGAPKSAAILTARDARATFATVASIFYPDLRHPPEAGPAEIAADAVIASTAVISAGAAIGARTRIGEGSWIGPGVVIGSDCVVAAHVTLSHCFIGDGVILHPGVRIGQDGFGFAPGIDGVIKIPQLGRVLIGDDVEIGANSAVDRGTLQDTEIGEGTKIDNLVQIGHNVKIGRACIIAAQAGIAGSCRIGDGVLIGGQAAVADHVTIGSGAQIGGKAGVMRKVAPGEAVMGYPAKPAKRFWREIATVSRLTKPKK